MKRFALFFSLSIGLYAQSTDAPLHVFRYSEPLTAASGAPPAEIAHSYLRSIAPELGLSAQDLDTVYIARQYKSSHNGATHLLFRQRLQDLEIRNAAWTVNIDSDGRVINAGGRLFPIPSGAMAGPGLATSVAAVRAAAGAVNPALAERYVPFTAGATGKGIRFSKGNFGEEIAGQPVWYAVKGVVQPAWQFTVVDANGIDSYSVVVDSQSRRVLAKNPLTFYQNPTPARGLVFEKGSPQPVPVPGTPPATVPPLVTRTLQPFAGDPTASPRGWVDGVETAGNNTVAGTNPDSLLCVTGIDTCFIRPDTVTAPNRDFSFPLELGGSAAPPTAYSDAVVVNMFYWTNRAHDLFYSVGFDEAAGNFQADNFGRGGVQGDAVFGYAQAGIQSANRALLNNADFGGFRIGEDGSRPRMRMFVWTLGSLFTDSGLDADVILHEYGHGVSFRLVHDLYTSFQGGSMGEAWSDFFALEFLTPEGVPADGIFAAPAGYSVQNFFSGDRTRPYSANFSVNPLTYANLGHVISLPEVHADGEIWVQALVEVRAALIRQFGEQEGRRRMRRIAIDSMKLSVPAPSMVDARDAVLLADRTTFAGASQQQIWTAFARRGLGVLAQSDNADSVHISPSFDTPSNRGSLQFYESRYTIGEGVRIVLQDGNLTAPMAGIQLTTSSGDLENVGLRRRGSVYYGEIGTRYAPVFRGDGALTLVPGDFISAYYTDANSGSGPALIERTVPTVPDYALSLLAPRPTQFPAETPLNLRTAFGGALRALPFPFPFYGKNYSAARIYNNGIITFDLPDFSPCSDLNSLRQLTAIAPMWMNLVTNGVAQPNEDVYVSETPDSVTFRWAAETAADIQIPGVTAAPQPVNFSATLFSNGNIEFRYGAGNRALISGSQLTGCPVSGATVGISNGHESLAQVSPLHDSQSSLENAPVVTFQSPYNPIGGPQIVLESPESGDTLSSLLSGKGVVFDSEPGVFIRRVDVLVDGVARSPAVTNVARPDYCNGRSILGCPNIGFTFAIGAALQGIGEGPHTLQVRATNSRGAMTTFPETPLAFTIGPGTTSGIFAALENPTDGQEISGRAPVTGYFGVDNARIVGVDVIVDGITYGAVQYGLLRTDVCGTLPSTVVNCPRIGFNFILNTTAQNPTGDILIGAGSHTLQLRARDESGRYFFFPEKPIAIVVNNPTNRAPRVAITTPYQNETVTGLMSIIGYAYDPDPEGRVVTLRVVVDGLSYASVTINYGSERPEVCAALTDVPACPNIGFELGFDTRRLANGPHTLNITATDDNGAIGYAQALLGGLNFFVNNP